VFSQWNSTIMHLYRILSRRKFLGKIQF
jgi:hypothetical protein